MDIPVPQVVGDTQIFKVFSEDRVQQVPSRSLTFSVEVFIAQVRVHLLLMNLVKGFFALKSAKGASHSGSELLPESAAQLEGSVEWVRLRERHAGKTFFWNRRTNSTVWRAPAGVEVVWFGERE